MKVVFHPMSSVNAIMPTPDNTHYPSSPPEFDFSDRVLEELLPRGLARSEIDANRRQWPPMGIDSYPRRSASPQLATYTLPAIEDGTAERLDDLRRGVAPGALSSDRYRRSEGPPPQSPLPIISSWQPEMLFPAVFFASPAAQGETDEVDAAIPAGTLRPWSRCGWVPNQDEPEPELAEFFDQHRIPPLPPTSERGVAELSMYSDLSGRIALGHPHLQPALSAPGSANTDYVPSDDEREEHPWTLPTTTTRLVVRSQPR